MLSAVTREVAAINTLLVAKVVAVDSKRWRAKERAAITRVLLSVARTARQVARIDGRVERTFVMPERRTDSSLLETARVFLREATPLEARFIGLGMPPTFLADLAERTGHFERAINWRRDARVAAAAARAGLDAAFRRAFDAVLLFDVVLANSRRDDPVVLETWKATRRIDRARKRTVKKRG